MKIATWNVNSLKVRLPHVLDFLARTGCDVLALQETKTPDDAFPAGELEAAGYASVFSGQKTYNGVAILAKKETVSVSDPLLGIPGYPDPQKRLAAATLTDREGRELRFISAYFPNGQAPGSAKFLYKLEWLEALSGLLTCELARHPRLAIAGDMNIAPEDRDVWDPAGWKGHILVSPAERDAFRSLLALGLRDTFRMFPQEEGSWSWWDYRKGAFQKNQGLRIDHVLVSRALEAEVKSAAVDRAPRALPQPSDHAPVVCEL